MPWHSCVWGWGNLVYLPTCATKPDFAHLAALLGAVKGKFILSLNDTPGVRETFSAFHIEALKTRYSISGTKKQEAAEVLISNFN